MFWLLYSHIQNAIHSLRRTRMRTALTMLGVAIGVGSITAILSLSSGANNMIERQIEEVGANITIVRPGATSGVAGLTQISNQPTYGTSTLTEKDLTILSKVEGVTDIAPLMILEGSIKSVESLAPESTALVTSSSFFKTTSITMNSGEFISDKNENKVVIGEQLSIDLFGTEDSLGRLITIRGITFHVGGVMQRINSPVNFNNVDLDRTVVIPLATGKKINQGKLNIQQVNVITSEQKETTASNIRFALLKSHEGEEDFSVLSSGDIAKPTSQFFYAITGATTAIASISLIVGGIGIMNILLVSVAERTREIGLRKAIGARNSDIVWQFMIESFAISLGGGVVGYIVGYLLSFVVSLQLTFSPALSWRVAAAAIGISALVGAVFGIYPAIRAARKKPIEALRQYE